MLRHEPNRGDTFGRYHVLAFLGGFVFTLHILD
jgi:hypothetical protein